MTFTFIPSTPPISVSFNFSFQLLDWPVGSDSLNTSARAHLVVCPLRRTRGHNWLVIYPLKVQEYRKEDSMWQWPFPHSMVTRPAAGRTRGFFHFFARSACPITRIVSSLFLIPLIVPNYSVYCSFDYSFNLLFL